MTIGSNVKCIGAYTIIYNLENKFRDIFHAPTRPKGRVIGAKIHITFQCFFLQVHDTSPGEGIYSMLPFLMQQLTQIGQRFARASRKLVARGGLLMKFLLLLDQTEHQDQFKAYGLRIQRKVHVHRAAVFVRLSQLKQNMSFYWSFAMFLSLRTNNR